MAKFTLETLIDKQRDYIHAVKVNNDIVDDNLLKKDILAFVNELGEMLNEWKQFKYWHKPIPAISYEKMLEEYVDGLSFILSILARRQEIYPDVINAEYTFPKVKQKEKTDENIIDLSLDLYRLASFLDDPIEYNHKQLIETYIYLGAMLGFSWDRILQAYLRKNKIKYRRLGIPI